MLRVIRRAKQYQDEEEEERETRLALVDTMLEAVLTLAQIKAFIYENPTGQCSLPFRERNTSCYLDMGQWRQFCKDKVNEATDKMNTTVEHLRELADTTQLTEERQSRYIEYKAMGAARMDDAAIYPCINLPHRRNPRFYGREKELKAIDDYLNPRIAKNLRTFTIYCRRGVGKTNIALEYGMYSTSGSTAGARR